MIPDEWKIELLGEFMLVRDGVHQTPTYTGSGVPFLRVTDIQDESINLSKTKYISKEEHEKITARLKPTNGDILYSKNGTIGITRIVDWDWEFSFFVSLALLRFKKDGYSVQYLAQYLQSDLAKREIYQGSKQGSVINLHLEEIQKFRVPIPPLLEQCRIAEILGVWDESIDLLEKLIGRVRSRKQGLMQQLLTGKKRFKEFEGSEWKKVSLENIADINPRNHPNNLQFMGEFVEMASVSESGHLKNVALIDVNTSISGYTAFINGDTLIAKITPCFENGKGALIEGLQGIGVGSTEFFVLRAKLEIIPIYLYYLTRTYDFGMRGKAMMQGSGGQQRVPSDFIKQFAVKLPSLPEQEKIAAVLSAVDEEISTLEKQLAAYKQQKLGLMQQLLIGRIRI